MRKETRMQTHIDQFDELRERIKRDLKDENNAFWSDEEIGDYINEAQYVYCEDTSYLRQQFPIISKENREVYNFPDDMIKLLRAENSEGDNLEFVDSKFLQKTYGDGFREVTGTAQYLYSDLDGEDQFRLYPRPSTSIEDGGNSTTMHVYQDIDISSVDRTIGLSITKWQDYIIVLKSNVIEFRNTNFQVVRSFIHGQTLSGNTQIVVAENENSSSTPDNGTVFFTSGENPSKIYKMTPAGAVSLFGTATVQITNLLPIMGGNYIIYSSSSQVYRTTSTSFSETSLSIGSITDYTSYKQGSSIEWYVAAGSNGIYRIKDSDGSATQMATESVNGIAILDNTTMYVNNASQLKTVDFTDTWDLSSITSLPLTTLTLSSGSAIIEGKGAIWVFINSNTVKIVDNLVDNTWSRLYKGYGGQPANTKNYSIEVSGNLLEVFYRDANFIRDQIATTNNEVGAVISVGTDDFDQDEGIVRDSIDADDTIIFEGENGAIVSNYEETDKGVLFFSREPKEDIIEVSDTKAIINYAKFLCLQKTGDREGLPKAEYFRENYQRQRDKQMNRASRGLNNNSKGTKPAFF